MKSGTLISIKGNIYEYVVYDERTKLHIVTEVDIDDCGHLTATYIPYAFTDADLKDTETQFTVQQCYGIVEHFIRQDFDYLTEDDINTAVEDIVDRCFVLNMPEFNELQGYIACYMNR